MIKKKHQVYLFMLPAMILIVCVQFAPMIYNFILSFMNVQINKPNLARKFEGLHNYVTILSDGRFWNSVVVTLQIAISSVIFQMLFGLGIALLLNIRGRYGSGPRGMGLFRGLLFIPYMLMPIMVGLIWFIFADPTYGMLNPILSHLGLPTAVWFSDSGTALWTIVAMDTWQCTPMVMLIISAGLKAINATYYEAAKIDGANSWQSFRFVTLPLLKPVLKVAVTMRLMDVMRIYDTIIATTKGGPGFKTEAISVYTQKLGFDKFKTSLGATAALLITLLILLMSRVIVRFFGNTNES